MNKNVYVAEEKSKIIQERNPEYKEQLQPSPYFQEGLLAKDLIALDVFVQGEQIRIRKKQKFIVQHPSIDDYWWLEEDDNETTEVHLYSVNDIYIHNGTVYITFCYQNGPLVRLEESEIMKLIHVPKKSKREDTEIQVWIEKLSP